ncbi:MAG: putative colanic acid biosynthesis acetyltransferase [Sumerlaeia bacterium]
MSDISPPNSSADLDIADNRRVAKYTRKELAMRVLWGGGKLAFRLSPRPLFGFRRWLLKLFGAKVGQNVNIYPDAVVYFPWNLEIGDWSSIGEGALIYNLGPVTIGKSATISQRAHLCAGTHDYTDPAMPLIKPPIVVEDQVWICADAFVGPNVTVGKGAVIGARAVVTRSVKPWKVVAGNPARPVKDRILKGGSPHAGN